MPCYTVTTIKTDVGKWNVDRWEIIKRENFKALSGIEYRNGEIISYTSMNKEQFDTKVLSAKRLYAEQTVKDASKRFGWRVAGKSVSQKGNITLQLKR